MRNVLLLAAAGVMALVGSAITTPLVMRISRRRQWYDIPNARKIHTDPIPRLGGVGIAVGLMLAVLAVPLLFPVLFGGSWPVTYDLRFVPLFLAFILINGMGLVDDFHNLHAILKLSIQIIAAALVTVGGFVISSFTLPGVGTISLGIAAYPATILWLVAISNALNLVDGVDGLAGGIAGLSALSLAVMCLVQGQLTPALISFALLGALAGFLIFNFPPARIFMGDSGSLLIGFVLASIPLVASPGKTTINALFAPATVLLFPILDTLSAIVRRTRQGKPIHSPDKEHIHHRLLALGLKGVPLLLVVYSACILIGAGAVISLFLSPWPACALIIGVWICAIAAFGIITALRRKQEAVDAGTEGPRSS
jgi:UDP-GlcNAc:undecaprenyl-phosphate/decaprenyl-phosphate GlcNAc-1-phosphate transferase